MEIMKEKPRRRSISELLDWRCLTGCKSIIAGNENGGDYFLEDCDKEPETRRRKRSGTWP